VSGPVARRAENQYRRAAAQEHRERARDWQVGTFTGKAIVMWRTAVLSVLALVLAVTAASAEIDITVNKSTQRLTVNVDGVPRYEWPVSTARWGYNTPNGTYQPQRLERTWYSRKYDMSPMPHSIFFAGGYAIHGSYEVSHLGRPASHGCIRLSPAHAATLYALVEGHRADTRIMVTGESPATYVASRREREYARPPRYFSREPDFQTIWSAPGYDGWAYGSPRPYWRN
jgi:L,D-transpeptidase catalytic domain